MYRPSGITGRGVYRCGEVKGVSPETVGKPTCSQPEKGEERSVKALGVTAIRPETGRSSRGQGEIVLTDDGGP